MVGGSGGSTNVRRATLEDASGVIELICEFDRRISHLSFAQVTRGALEFMADRLGVARASVALRIDGGQGFTIFDSTFDIRGIESGRVIPPNSASLAATVQQGVPVYREDIRLWPTPNPVDDALISAGIFATFSVPLVGTKTCRVPLSAVSRMSVEVVQLLYVRSYFDNKVTGPMDLLSS